MKLRLLFLVLMIGGYWWYLHEFQDQAMQGLSVLKNNYSQATAETVATGAALTQYHK